MKEIRVGFLGAGRIAAQHARSLQKLPDVKIVAICTRQLAKAQEFVTRNVQRSAACFSDFSKMLAETPMDALYACIPPGAHHGEVEAAAAQGVHLFLEKPIALSLSRAESIATSVRRSGVKCQIGHHMRHLEPARRLKAMIDDGSAGRPLLMQAHWFCSALHGAWWRDPNMGGGQLLEQAIHIFDLARYFLGNAISVSGFAGNLGKTRFAEYPVDDTSAAIVRFRNGSVASICASNSADPWHPSVGATVVCEKVLVQFRIPEDASFLFHNGMVAEEAWKPGVQRRCEDVKSIINAGDEINRNFINALRGEEAMRSGIADGVEGLRLVLAVAKSSANGGNAVSLSSESNSDAGV